MNTQNYLEYELLDSGEGKKLEKIGKYKIIRPSLNAYWKIKNPELWKNPDGILERDKGLKNINWSWKNKPLESWIVSYGKIVFKIKPTDFGHIGLFPEQKDNWNWLRNIIDKNKTIKTLNLFAYSGGSSIAMAQSGASVCHVDAAKGMIEWAKENVKLNNNIKGNIRWIVDDVFKFINREIKRENYYSGIILDPPSFGRGPNGQIWKIENDLPALLEKCRILLSKDPKFILLTMHSNGFSSLSLDRIIRYCFGNNLTIETGEMFIQEKSGYKLPAGIFCRCIFK